MSQLQIDQVLAQIRSLSVEAGGGIAQGTAAGATTASSFATLLKSGLEQVNQTQLQANDLADKFERGAPGVDLPQVMLEANKASLSFRAVTEVRNRLISAYQDIMNMQL